MVDARISGTPSARSARGTSAIEIVLAIAIATNADARARNPRARARACSPAINNGIVTAKIARLAARARPMSQRGRGRAIAIAIRTINVTNAARRSETIGSVAIPTTRTIAVAIRPAALTGWAELDRAPEPVHPARRSRTERAP